MEIACAFDGREPRPAACGVFFFPCAGVGRRLAVIDAVGGVIVVGVPCDFDARFLVFELGDDRIIDGIFFDRIGRFHRGDRLVLGSSRLVWRGIGCDRDRITGFFCRGGQRHDGDRGTYDQHRQQQRKVLLHSFHSGFCSVIDGSWNRGNLFIISDNCLPVYEIDNCS